jgi:hypothetical protein
VKIPKMNIAKRGLLACIILSYAWGIALGNLTHNFLHHIGEKDHHHSFPCLIVGSTEIPADEARGFSQLPSITASDCNFKLALHSLCRPTTSGATQSLEKIIVVYETPIVAIPVAVWVKEILVSSISSRGPPFRA